ncbi:hypothetical protein HK105_201317 [Polyrhizophydium stewartii]|uniref:Ankyrin repeat protein n=1 Tax=Polyrhizophydium stewartii TaxID=2732419 RepID=A0ABR4NHR0_9FUNG
MRGIAQLPDICIVSILQHCDSPATLARTCSRIAAAWRPVSVQAHWLTRTRHAGDVHDAFEDACLGIRSTRIAVHLLRCHDLRPVWLAHVLVDLASAETHLADEHAAAVIAAMLPTDAGRGALAQRSKADLCCDISLWIRSLLFMPLLRRHNQPQHRGEQPLSMFTTAGEDIAAAVADLGGLGSHLAAENVNVVFLINEAAGRPIRAGFAAVFFASCAGNTAVVEALLHNEVRGRIDCRCFGDAALVVACAQGHARIVELLVDLGGADVQARGGLPLRIALRNRFDGLATFLVSRGAQQA